MLSFIFCVCVNWDIDALRVFGSISCSILIVDKLLIILVVIVSGDKDKLYSYLSLNLIESL